MNDQANLILLHILAELKTQRSMMDHLLAKLDMIEQHVLPVSERLHRTDEGEQYHNSKETFEETFEDELKKSAKLFGMGEQ